MNKLIWTEGLLLGQQHFQYWDRYWSDVLAHKFPVKPENASGIERLVLDMDALNRNTVRLIDYKVVLAGSWFNAQDIGILTLELPALATTPDVFIYLVQANGGAIKGIEGYPQVSDSPSHAHAYHQKLKDDYDPVREREVLFAKPSLSLKVQTPDSAKERGLIIAKLKLSASGLYKLDPEFIAPILNVASSDRLSSLLQTLIFQLDTSIQSLKTHRFERLKDTNLNHLADTFGPILVSLAIYSQRLKLQMADSAHPKVLYDTLTELVAACTTAIALEPLPISLPYDHFSQTVLWRAMREQVNALLSQLKPSTLRQVRLLKESESFYVATGLERKCFTEMTLLLSVEMGDLNGDWTSDFCRKVKIAAQDDMPRVLASALPGLKIETLKTHPMHLPFKPGKAYFAFDAYGECWNTMKKQSSFAVFLPVEFKDLKIELILLSD